ncbi:hypothetical protein BH09GEM1_BH09GEM1_26860 [soil metagenome]
MADTLSAELQASLGNARMGKCVVCADRPLALVYDGRGDRDRAIAAFERTQILAPSDENRGPVLRRLGELYEARGDVRNAIDRFQRFVTLRKRADPELQPQVAEVRKKIALLQTLCRRPARRRRDTAARLRHLVDSQLRRGGAAMRLAMPRSGAGSVTPSSIQGWST